MPDHIEEVASPQPCDQVAERTIVQHSDIAAQGATVQPSCRRSQWNNSSSEDYQRSEESCNSPQLNSPISYAISSANLTSIFQFGPAQSNGSSKHPDQCEPCVYYCFSKKGCNKGDACDRCHGFHESKLRKKRERWKKDVRQLYQARVAKKRGTEEPYAETEAGIRQVEESEELAGPAPSPEIEYMQDYIQDSLDCSAVTDAPWPVKNGINAAYCADIPGVGVGNGFDALQTSASMANAYVPAPSVPAPNADVFSYTPSNVVATLGQKVELMPLTFGKLIFAIAPNLPRGLSIDMHTGLIHGAGQELTTGPETYFVTACEPSPLIHRIKVATINISIVNPTPSPLDMRAFMPSTQPNVNAGSVDPVAIMQEALASQLQGRLLQTLATIRQRGGPKSGSVASQNSSAVVR